MRVPAAILAVLVLALASCGGDDEVEGPEPSPGDLAFYHLEEQVTTTEDGVVEELTGEPALDATEVLRETAHAEGTRVVVSFTSVGARAFSQLSRQVSNAGFQAGEDHHIAVISGDRLVASPSVSFEDYPTGFREAPGVAIHLDDEQAAADLVERIQKGVVGSAD